MLLCVDIGNTSVVFGWFRGRNLEREIRLKTDAGRTADEYRALLIGALPPGAALSQFKPERAIISSVAPHATQAVREALRGLYEVSPLVVGPGVKTGLQIKVKDPQGLGSDRVVNALAARELYGFPSVVIDFGTAIAFDVIGLDGSYEGGIIAPGPEVALEGLVAHAAKLQRVELSSPKSVIGKNTATALQSGMVIGFASLIDGLVAKIERELGAVKFIIATGPLAEFFAAHSARIQHCDEHLTLRGLVLLAELNPEETET